MRTEPKVSVIIPVYNAEKYLRQCLDSVVNQTLKEIEIICVDDGSTDHSLQILREYESMDNRITVLTQKNINAGAARNKGLAFACGKYLAFLDSDDYFKENMLAECCQQIEKDESDVVVFSAQQFDMATQKTTDMPWSLRLRLCPKFSPFAASDMPKYIFNAFQNWPWNKLFRRTFILENELTFQEIPRTNDMAFVCMALVLARKISIIDQSFTIYRVGTGTSLQSTNDMAPMSFWDAYKETKRRLVARGLYTQYEQSFLNTVLQGTFYNLNAVKSEAAHREIEALLKGGADEEFAFTAHPARYYYDQKQYAELMAIKNHEPMPPRGIRSYIQGGIQCCRENGLAYTVQRILEHLHLK